MGTLSYEDMTDKENEGNIMLKFVKENGKKAGKDPHERISVWSHTTSYAGALGIHSEIGRGAYARNSTAENDLKNTMSAMESIHKKEIQHMDFTKKYVESSMVAYSQKMKKISIDKYADRIKTKHNEQKARIWGSMTKLYDEAIKTVSSQVNYNNAFERDRSKSFSYPKTSTPDLRRVSHSDQETLGAGTKTQKSRRMATVAAPLFLPSISTDHCKSVSLDDIRLNEESSSENLSKVSLEFPEIDSQNKNRQTVNQENLVSNETRDKTLLISSENYQIEKKERKESVPVSGAVISTYPGLTEDQICLFNIPNPENEHDSTTKSPRETLNQKKHSVTTYHSHHPKHTVSKPRVRKISKKGNHRGNPPSEREQKSKDDMNCGNRLGNEGDSLSDQSEFNPFRRRSLSMPTSLKRHPKHSKTNPLVDSEGNEIVLKSVLRQRKTSDITYMMKKKSVQFQLPDIDKSQFELYRTMKCEQSPNTITIISNE